MKQTFPPLPRRWIAVLLNGSHADIGGRARKPHGRKLLLIAASYSFAELLEEKGVGMATALDIRDWFQAHGLSLK